MKRKNQIKQTLINSKEDIMIITVDKNGNVIDVHKENEEREATNWFYGQ